MTQKAFLVSALLFACTSAETPSHVLVDDSAALTSALPSRAAGKRFDHQFSKSRFDTGPNQHAFSEGPLEKIAGSKGVFSTYAPTGAVLATRLAPSAEPRKLAPISAYPQGFTDDADLAISTAQAYFAESGIPVDEIAGAHVTTTMGGSGPTTDGVVPVKSHFLWHTAHLERSVSGIAVEGSFAFAAFDKTKATFREGVYWPAIPESVVLDAQALKETIGAADRRAAFLRQVVSKEPGADGLEGTVKIVHTSALYPGEFSAQAVYEVVMSGPGKSRILRFDRLARKVELPDEKSASASSLRP